MICFFSYKWQIAVFCCCSCYIYMLSMDNIIGHIQWPVLHNIASNHLLSPLVTTQLGNMVYHGKQNLSNNDPMVRKNDRILMKQWWFCACDSPKATTEEVWKGEMIKGKLCSVENRAIIGRAGLSLLPLFPREASSLECNGANVAH